MILRKIIENHWYKKNNFFLTILLYPFEIIFICITKIRHFFYKSGIFKQNKLPIPVIIIGNISVGGAGKTPLTKYLTQELTNLGFNIGIILRGYKGQNQDAYIVNKDDNSQKVGDEALIYAQSGFKVAIGKNRYLAGKILCDTYPNIQLILADDGLQHYALNRDYEIAVVDGMRMFGNKHCLPMGPLREEIKRLNSINAIVVNGKPQSQQLILQQFKSKLLIQQNMLIDRIYNPITNVSVTSEFFNNKNNVALAAIGNPQRFFDLLTQIGIITSKHYNFPDHYYYKLDDIPKQADTILVTEKDYVKLAQFNDDRIWVVFVKSQLNNSLLLTQIQQLIFKN